MTDYRTPSPDDGHEAIRKPLADAIDRLDAQIEQMDDAFLLLSATVDFARSTLNTVLSGQGAIFELAARVKALEAAMAPLHTPDSDPVPDGDGAPEDLTQ